MGRGDCLQSRTGRIANAGSGRLRPALAERGSLAGDGDAMTTAPGGGRDAEARGHAPISDLSAPYGEPDFEEIGACPRCGVGGPGGWGHAPISASHPGRALAFQEIGACPRLPWPRGKTRPGEPSGGPPLKSVVLSNTAVDTKKRGD